MAEPIPVHDRVMYASVDYFCTAGMTRAQFKTLCAHAGVTRQSAYRAFPDGIDDVVRCLHRNAVSQVVAGIAEATRSLGPSVDFDEVVAAGLQGAVNGLRESDLTRAVLANSPRLRAAYLLDTSPGSALSLLADYCARCAAVYGSQQDETTIVQAARVFILSVFDALLARIEADGEGWPVLTPETLAALLTGPAAAYVEAVGLARAAEKRSRLAVPSVEAPAQTYESVLTAR